MITFQLDECLNDKALAADCNSQGLATAFRFPKTLKGKTDSEVISGLLNRNNPFLTKDTGFVDDHIKDMPELHPGVVIIHNGYANPQTITIKIVRKILAKLKEVFPEWHQVDLRNSIVELTPESIQLQHLEGWNLILDSDLSLEEERLVASVMEVLTRNANRMPQIES